MNLDDRFPRSGETRARITSAARRLFSTRGYERTTIRAVASEAKIDPALVMRYFGNKEGLFTAALNFDLAIPDLTAGPRRSAGETLVRHLLVVWEGPKARDNLPALLRTAATNPTALKKIQAIVNKQIRPAIAPVCDPERLEEAAGLVASQTLGLAFTRYVLKLPAVTKLTQDVLVTQLGRTLQRYITG